MQVFIGNPDLKQAYSHNISMNYSTFLSELNSFISSNLSLSMISNSIVNSTIILQKDSVITQNLTLPAGGQIIKPVNINGYYNLNAGFYLSFPFDLISSKLNFNFSAGLANMPNYINQSLNNSQNRYLNGMLMIASNISENLDFKISIRFNLSSSNNSISYGTALFNNNIQNSANVKWIIWSGLFVQFDYRNSIYSNISGFSKFNLLNFSFGKKLFDSKLELKLSGYDLLNQNNALQINTTEFYSERINRAVLTRYFMIELNYNFRNY